MKCFSKPNKTQVCTQRERDKVKVTNYCQPVTTWVVLQLFCILQFFKIKNYWERVGILNVFNGILCYMLWPQKSILSVIQVGPRLLGVCRNNRGTTVPVGCWWAQRLGEPQKSLRSVTLAGTQGLPYCALPGPAPPAPFSSQLLLLLLMYMFLIPTSLFLFLMTTELPPPWTCVLRAPCSGALPPDPHAL